MLFVLFFLMRNTAAADAGIRGLGKCDASQGEICSATQPAGYTKAYFRVFGGCVEGTVCWHPTAETKAKLQQSGQIGPQKDAPSRRELEPRIVITRGFAGSGIPANSDIRLMNVLSESERFNVALSLPYNYPENHAACANTTGRDDIVCRGDWVVQVLLENEQHEILLGSCALTAPGARSQCLNAQSVGLPVRTQARSQLAQNFLSAGQKSTRTPEEERFLEGAKISAAFGLLKLEETLQAGADTGDTVSAEFDINVLDQLLGQRFSLTIRAYPAHLEGAMEIQQGFWITFEPGVRYAGLSQRWEQKKVIDVRCTSPAVCEEIYYSIEPPQDAQAPSCSNFPDAQEQLAAAQRAAERLPIYCVTDGQIIYECTEGNSACEEKRRGLQDTGALRTALADLVSSATENELISPTDPRLAQFFDLADRADSLKCAANIAPERYVGIDAPPSASSRTNVKEVSTLSKRLVFKADEWNPQTQKGSFVLDEAFMGTNYLCVYGKDAATGRIYSAGPARQVFIDAIAPAAKIKFRPLSRMMEFSCDDSQSGCEDEVPDRFSYAYVRNPAKYFQSIFDWSTAVCPPAGSSEYRKAHDTRIRHESTEVQVVCLQAQDGAGNRALARKIVYNAPDLLIKSIVLAGVVG